MSNVEVVHVVVLHFIIQHSLIDIRYSQRSPTSTSNNSSFLKYFCAKSRNSVGVIVRMVSTNLGKASKGNSSAGSSHQNLLLDSISSKQLKNSCSDSATFGLNRVDYQRLMAILAGRKGERPRQNSLMVAIGERRDDARYAGPGDDRDGNAGGHGAGTIESRHS